VPICKIKKKKKKKVEKEGKNRKCFIHSPPALARTKSFVLPCTAPTCKIQKKKGKRKKEARQKMTNSQTTNTCEKITHMFCRVLF